MTRRVDVVEVAWGLSVALVALGAAIAVAAVRAARPWRW